MIRLDVRKNINQFHEIAKESLDMKYRGNDSGIPILYLEDEIGVYNNYIIIILMMSWFRFRLCILIVLTDINLKNFNVSNLFQICFLLIINYVNLKSTGEMYL